MPEFHIELSEIAREQITILVGDRSKKAVAKAVIKSLGLMRTNIKHPSLNTHKYDEMTGPNGEIVFESYVLLAPIEFFGFMVLESQRLQSWLSPRIPNMGIIRHIFNSLKDQDVQDIHDRDIFVLYVL